MSRGASALAHSSDRGILRRGKEVPVPAASGHIPIPSVTTTPEACASNQSERPVRTRVTTDALSTDRQRRCGGVMGARHVCEWCNGWRRGSFAACNATPHGASPLPPVPSICRQTRPTPPLPRETRFYLAAGAGGRRTPDCGEEHFPYWGIVNFYHR